MMVMQELCMTEICCWEVIWIKEIPFQVEITEKEGADIWCQNVLDWLGFSIDI